ncbi:hypothetical protein EHQ27_11640 [Leptospira wolffii]|nr:hypothetical protein [Leptospira wolffii]TGK71052.1 hypothetical protein EHQ27_11640 [Leptospira wolffii]TGK75743.1 hypothetical protein EHQ35_05090 [Leptospira wolffii]TGL32791.1 hypothetical protein EHQ57_02050 [Leptospira wolffii]
MRRASFLFIFFFLSNCITSGFVTNYVSPKRSYGFSWIELSNAAWGTDGYLYVRAKVIVQTEEQAGQKMGEEERCYRSEKVYANKPFLLEKPVPCESLTWMPRARTEIRNGLVVFPHYNFSLALPALGQNNAIFCETKDLPKAKPDRIFRMRKNPLAFVLHYPDDSYYGIDLSNSEKSSSANRIDPHLLEGTLAEALEFEYIDSPNAFSMLSVARDGAPFTSFLLKKQGKGMEIAKLNIYSDLKTKEEFHAGMALLIPFTLAMDVVLVALVILAK